MTFETKLFIDDLRDPPVHEFRPEHDYIVIRSYAEAIGWMRQNGCPNFISFDHDLGSIDGLDGVDIVKWMINRDLDSNFTWMPEHFAYTVHSANPVGAANIVGMLDGYIKTRLDRLNNSV